jgi:hypothetical protein
MVCLSAAELRRLLARLVWHARHSLEHILHWSGWRRRHQWRAMMCHYKRRGFALPEINLRL